MVRVFLLPFLIKYGEIFTPVTVILSVANSNRKPILLDFEKPLVELESRIDQIR